MGKTPEGDAKDSQVIETLFNSSTCGVAIIDIQFRYVRVNDTLARMNGLAPDLHIGKTVGEVLGDKAADIEEHLEEVFATGDRLDNFHLAAKLPARSGPSQWNVSYFPMKNSEGQVTQVCAIVNELREDYYRVGYHWKRTSPVQRHDTHLLQSLTKRQFQVMQLIASGKSNKEVAAALNITIRTAEVYRARVMERLGIHSLVDLVHFAIRNGVQKI